MHRHQTHMLHALSLSKRNLGLTAPNPSVGCIIVKDGCIIGRGVTAPGGRPHAETLALVQAGGTARGATAYVTLEPCCHQGQTPPCTDALIDSGVAHVVIATRDPNPKVAGKGVAALQAAGIIVTEGICEAQAQHDHAGFFLTIRENRPLVTLKLALTADGKLIVQQGGWFTSELARHYVHLLRYQHDGILVGSSTVLMDNPGLTCRLPGMAHGSPVRFVLDRRKRAPANAECAPYIRLDAPQLGDNLTRIAEHGITRLLVECGSELGSALLEGKHVDRLILIEAPEVTGASNAINMKQELQRFLPDFTPERTRTLGTNNVTYFSLGKHAFK